MSATNRGAKREPRDFYATPLSAFEPLLPYLAKCGRVWIDPAQGDGRLVTALAEWSDVAFGYDLYPQDGAKPVNFLDGLTYPCKLRMAVGVAGIVTNPPYSKAFEFCQQAVARFPQVFLLLRLNFLAGKCRRQWFCEHEPAALFVLSQRPSFCNNKHGRKGTDATDYAWYYWGHQFKGIYHL